MKELFPYHGEKILVTQEMCDHNGHMNTGSYTRCFDGCWGQMYTDMGFDDNYFNRGYSSFTLEENLKYFKEFLEGDSIYPCFRIVNVNRKIIHHAAILLNEKKELSAISECLLIHIDMKLRKSAPMPDETFERVKKLKDKHEALGPLDFELRLKIKN